MQETFGDQFLKLTDLVRSRNQNDSEIEINKQADLLSFENNANFLLEDSHEKLPFPSNVERFPPLVQAIFETLRQFTCKADLLNLLEAECYSERIINVYFKILECMNLVQLSRDNHLRTKALLETPDGRTSVNS